jgi:hypothetical protein
LYSFSWYGGLSTVSFVDINGNPKWQYSTPDGDSLSSNIIKFKELDLLTDMVVATSGSSYINYNRIISSSSSPFSVSDKKTFRDPTSSASRKLYGLYIIDQNNAVSLIYDNLSLYTDLATINF